MVSPSFHNTTLLWTSQEDDEYQNDAFKKPFASSLGETVIEKWPMWQTMRLLRFYGVHRCLWDTKNEDNSNRKMRHAALLDITAAMGGELTKNQIVQKINVIRATYRYEKKRIKQRMERGLGAKTKLKWFPLADAFLRKVPKKRRKLKSDSNFHSDLEDEITFPINYETLGPLLGEYTTQKINELPYYNILELKEENINTNEDIFKQNEYDDKSKEFSDLKAIEDDLQKQLEILNTSDNKYVHEMLEISGVDSFTSIPKQEQSKDHIKAAWSLETTIQFIHLLKKNSILLTSNLSLELVEESQKTALEAIAREMCRTYKSIEKRWQIFRQTYHDEKLKILENPHYIPLYKWWIEADHIMESMPELKMEAIYLDEFHIGSDNEEQDYESRFENPIPSVAPMSNMNEEMASLFHDEFLLDSKKNLTPDLDTGPLNCDKIIWKGIEDDLLEGKWSLKHSVKFLRLYGAHRCLWDLKDPDYRSRKLRNAAIEDIAASMGYNLTPAYVAKKIKIFRITYMQQRKRILDATQKGLKPDILLKWFPLADSFLRPHIGLRSIQPDAKEIPQFDFQYVYANLNLIDPALLNDFRGKGTQNAINIGDEENVFGNSDDE
ncbi:uncharacterized protein LOC142224247 [Haematobia irritans]|uniref:uncharacterized protein LOC142224247 n=1 Tax=Haematobia irritans TaxID=7368 RepID=UPI003F4FFE3F